MAILNIPRRQYAALKALSELNDGQFRDLVKGLNEIEASVSPTEFSEHLAERIKTIDADAVEQFVTLLLGLYPAKENNNKTAGEIASDIRETVEDEKPALFPTDKATLVESRMRELLTIDKAVAVTAKAYDVITEHANVFCGVRIFSDIRPVFSSSADSVSAAAVVHTLNLSYHEGPDHKEFYIALDGEDLNLIRESIQRAEKKAIALKNIVEKSGITYLEQGV